MDNFKIKNLIFSSSATVYGILNNSPLTESSPLSSINPYGSTKIIIEQLITEYSKSNKNFKAISLRYFNPIGSNVNSGLTDQPLGEPLNLMPLIIEAALGKRVLTVYGDDYDTSDGTCIRDYIHVQDLAEAHIKALRKINLIKSHVPVNIGMGKGISVLNLIKIFEEVNNIKVPYKIGKRRKGDAPITFSSNLKAKETLDWSPRYKYEDMCRHSWLSKSKMKILILLTFMALSFHFLINSNLKFLIKSKKQIQNIHKEETLRLGGIVILFWLVICYLTGLLVYFNIYYLFALLFLIPAFFEDLHFKINPKIRFSCILIACFLVILSQENLPTFNTYFFDDILNNIYF